MQQTRSLVMSKSASRLNRFGQWTGQSFLFLVTSLSLLAVLFIFFFIARDAIPFFRIEGFKAFFTSTHWFPSGHPPEFGTLAIIYGSGIVTLGAILLAVPLGVSAAVCMSDVLPFNVRQIVKPVIEMLAAIPSVAYGFFALVVFAPMLQQKGGHLLAIAVWVIGAPVLALLAIVLGDLIAERLGGDGARRALRFALTVLFLLAGAGFLVWASSRLNAMTINSGTNALNVSIILGIMALPTVVSVSEDALQAVGRELREGSYALGATRAETMLLTVMPAAISGIIAAIILGVMRAIGETMVVWMASGNAAQIPTPWYDFLAPVRTLTATIAGDMGEADHVTGSARYHVLFAMALLLLTSSFLMNLASDWITKRERRKLGK